MQEPDITNLSTQAEVEQAVLLHAVETDYYILSKSLSLHSHLSVFEASQETFPNELGGSTMVSCPRVQFTVFPKKFQMKIFLMLLRLIKGAA